jgi:hypothetical protein
MPRLSLKLRDPQKTHQTDAVNDSRRNVVWTISRVPDRIFWAGVFLACSCILASSAGSQRSMPRETATLPARSAPARAVVSKVPPATTPPTTINTLRARQIELTDGQGRTRIRLAVQTDGDATVEFVRPGEDTPTLALYDILRGKENEGAVASEGRTGLHINGPTRDGQYGLVKIERVGAAGEANVRIARGSASGLSNHATIEPGAIRFIKSTGDVKARSFGFEN